MSSSTSVSLHSPGTKLIESQTDDQDCQPGKAASSQSAKVLRSKITYKTASKRGRKKRLAMNAAAPKKGFSCSICNFRTYSKERYDIHELLHQKSSTYKCSVCSYSTNNVMFLNRHINCGHPNTTTNEELVTDYSYGDVNIADNSGGMNEEEAENDSLDQDASTAEEAVAMNEEEAGDESSFQDASTNGQPPQFRCDICSYSTKKEAAFATHQAAHKQADRYSCPICTFSAHFPSFIKMHLKKHHSEDVKNPKTVDLPQKTSNKEDAPSSLSGIYKCRFCEFRTKFTQQFNTHMLRHQKKSKFTCDICSFSTPKQGVLSRHLNHHHLNGAAPAKSTEEEFHQCQICEFSTPFEDNMKIHNRRHEQESEFCCNFCSYSSTKKQYMEQHMARDHSKGTESGQLESSQCDTEEDGDTLKEATSGGSKLLHQCSQCDFSTDQVKNLKKHEKRHGKVGGKFRCQHCDFSASDNLSVYRHLKFHHRYVPPGGQLQPTPPPSSIHSDELEGITKDKPSLPDSMRSDLEVPDRTPALPSGEAIQNTFVNVSSEEDVTTDNQNELTKEMEEHRLEDNGDMDTSDLQPILDEEEKGDPLHIDLLAVTKIPEVTAKKRNSSLVGKAVLQCQKCDFSTTFSPNLTAHSQKHGRKLKFQCPSCDYSSSKKFHVDDHAKRYHNSEAATSEPLDNSSVSHLSENQVDELDEIQMGPTYIEMDVGEAGLESSTANDASMSDSYQTNEYGPLPEEPPTIQNVVSSTPNVSGKFSQKVLFCPKCSFWARTPERFHEHFVSHLSDGAFRCSECDFVGKYRKYVISHIRKTFAAKKHRDAEPITNITLPDHKYEEFRQSMAIRSGVEEGWRNMRKQSSSGMGNASKETQKELVDMVSTSAPGTAEPERKKMKMDTLMGDVMTLVPFESLDEVDLDENGCEEAIATTKKSIEDFYRIINGLQKDFTGQAAISRGEKIKTMRSRVDMIKDKVRIGTEEVNKLFSECQDVQKKLAEAETQKVKAELAVRMVQCDALQLQLKIMESAGSEEAAKSFDEANEKVRQSQLEVERTVKEVDSIRIQNETLSEQLEEAEESRNGASQVLETLENELAALESVAYPNARIAELKSEIDEMIRKKVRLEEELVKITYLKSLDQVRRQGREWLLSLNHQYLLKINEDGEPIPVEDCSDLPIPPA